MLDRRLDCIAETEEGARPIHVIRPNGLAAFLETLTPAQANFLRDSEFAAKSGELRLLPGETGVAGAAFGIGDDTSPFAFGGLPTQLPSVHTWQLQPGDYDLSAATLWYFLGAYRYTKFRPEKQQPARLAIQPGFEMSLSQASATWMVRDLINTPANLLGPVELADLAVTLAKRFGAEASLIADAALEADYPTIAAVGAGSSRPPRVVVIHWRGSAATDASPLVSLCGKGVCFDTGGYDLKPSSAMLRMKKDMGGAANVLGLARLVMEADLPIRLAVRIGCVENSVSGNAMRPSDVIRTRSGKTVEIGNTDAEGRLVLCDLLDDAAAESPSVLIDLATLTGAARVALGPDLPALFSNDDRLASMLLRCGERVNDPLWRLPLWDGYNEWLKSSVADINNVAAKPMAGAVVAGLFLQRFVPQGLPFIHIDLYAWNDSGRAGRPEGGEAMTMRALFAFCNSLCEL